MNPFKTFAIATALALSLGAAAAGAAEAVNINTASAQVLARTIEGVGPARAAEIVAYRDKHGPFTRVDDLALVRGIGPSIVDGNRDVLSIDPTR